jgi:hypothetical protein
MPVHNVCQLMNVSDYKVWKLLDIYVDEARFLQVLAFAFFVVVSWLGFAYFLKMKNTTNTLNKLTKFLAVATILVSLNASYLVWVVLLCKNSPSVLPSTA